MLVEDFWGHFRTCIFLIFLELKSHFRQHFFWKRSSICASRRGHLWPSDVTFLGLFAVEIYFSMMFTFSLVYARAFGNRQILRSWKILKSKKIVCQIPRFTQIQEIDDLCPLSPYTYWAERSKNETSKIDQKQSYVLSWKLWVFHVFGWF